MTIRPCPRLLPVLVALQVLRVQQDQSDSLPDLVRLDARVELRDGGVDVFEEAVCTISSASDTGPAVLG